MKILAAALSAILLTSTASPAQEYDTRGEDGPPGGQAKIEWCLTGTVVNLFEIPGSGGAWAVGILKINDPGITPIDTFCDREQSITTFCADTLKLFHVIQACGLIVSNEPFSSHRLSIRQITFFGDDSKVPTGRE